MTLNRTAAPEFGEIKDFSFTRAETLSLDNGIPCHCIHAGSEEVVRIDFYFPAGSRYQSHRVVASATNALLAEGSKHNSAAALAEKLDYYGAFTQHSCTVEEGTFSLYCLKKHVEPCLLLVREILCEPAFPQHELQIYRATQTQKLLVNQQKNSYLARIAFYHNQFGENSPYGQSATTEDYSKLMQEDLQRFHSAHYIRPAYLIASGMVDADVRAAINRTWGSLPASGSQPQSDMAVLFPPHKPEKEVIISKPDSLQAAIRVGRTLFDRTHPDYMSLQLVNLLLGGFFGSRLMKNIREEKGLTYGIHSSVESYKGSGIFCITTEVNNDLYPVAVKEIMLELERLCTEPVPEQELNVARNYLLGAFLRSVDGAFAIADRFKILNDFGLDYGYYTRFIDTVKNLTPAAFQEIAQRYLEPEQMNTIVVSKIIN